MTALFIFDVLSASVVLCLTKARHGFCGLDWPLTNCATCDVGKKSVLQPKDEFTVQQFAPSYFVGMKLDIRRLLVFDSRCLRSISRVFWDHGVKNPCVKNRVPREDDKPIDKVVSLHQLRVQVMCYVCPVTSYLNGQYCLM